MGHSFICYLYRVTFLTNKVSLRGASETSFSPFPSPPYPLPPLPLSSPPRIPAPLDCCSMWSKPLTLAPLTPLWGQARVFKILQNRTSLKPPRFLLPILMASYGINATCYCWRGSSCQQGEDREKWTGLNRQRTLPVTLFNLITFLRIGDYEIPILWMGLNSKSGTNSNMGQ